MPKRLFSIIIVVVVFASLILTASVARAATIEFLDLNFGNGYTAIGTLPFDVFYSGGVFYGPASPDRYIAPSSLTLEYNGSPLVAAQYSDFQYDPWGLGNNTGEPYYFFPPTYDPNDPKQKYAGFQGGESFTTNLDHIPNTYADFFLNGSPAISGDVSTIPLPSTMPLFGCAILFLIGIAWLRRAYTKEAT